MSEFMCVSAKENRTTIPGQLISGRYRQPFGYRVKRSRGTKDFYLTMTLQGNGLFHNGHATCECPERFITLITPGTPHYYGTPENTVWEFNWCHFVPKEEWLPWLQLPEAVKGIRFSRFDNDKDWHRLDDAFRSLIQEGEGKSWLSERLAFNALEKILLLISQNGLASRDPMDPRVELAVKLISQQFPKPFTVSELAAIVNLSPSRFAHLFKMQTGDSVMEMLNKIRLRQSRRLLETTALTIAEIAEEVGFNHPFYFSRQFAAFYGTPPAVFRKQIHEFR